MFLINYVLFEIQCFQFPSLGGVRDGLAFRVSPPTPSQEEFDDRFQNWIEFNRSLNLKF
jgi:hypothetical protein